MEELDATDTPKYETLSMPERDGDSNVEEGGSKYKDMLAKKKAEKSM